MTAVAVELCGCSHAERMHERDVDAENGRGACMARGGDCGCSEFRPGLVDVEVPDPPVEAVEPVEAEVVEAPRVVAIAAPALSSPSFSCGSCDRRFTSKQALGGHTSRGHKTRAVADSSPVEPDRPVEAPAAVIPPTAAGDLAQDDGGQDCSNCGDAVIALSPRGWCDGCEEEAEAASSVVEKSQVDPAAPVHDDGRRHDALIRIDLGGGQHVTFRGEKVTAAVLHDWLAIIDRFLAPGQERTGKTES